LLEHKIFNLFYNWPLTIRRRMRKRSDMRAAMPPRYWHIVLCAIAGTGIFSIVDLIYLDKLGDLPNLRVIWGFAVIVPLLIGIVATSGAGGAPLWKRIAGAALCGVAVGVLSAIVSGFLGTHDSIVVSTIAINGVWRAFIFTLVSVLGVLVTEIKMPNP